MWLIATLPYQVSICLYLLHCQQWVLGHPLLHPCTYTMMCEVYPSSLYLMVTIRQFPCFQLLADNVDAEVGFWVHHKNTYVKFALLTLLLLSIKMYLRRIIVTYFISKWQKFLFFTQIFLKINYTEVIKIAYVKCHWKYSGWPVFCHLMNIYSFWPKER